MQIVKERQQFQRVEVSRDEAMSMFQENPFKIEILSNLPEEATITLYRCGSLPRPYRAHIHNSFSALHPIVLSCTCPAAARKQVLAISW